MSELFISGGIVIDPEKRERFKADVLLNGGVIAAIGDLTAPEGAQVIDASGRLVCPGFIDPHGHIDGHQYTAELSLLQGITTTAGGNCGFSPLDLEKFFAEQKAFPIHQAEMIGMCALRHAAGVYDPFQAASEEQVDRMAALCDKALCEGACGVSLGPAYTPGSSILEMQELCRVAKMHGKPVSIDTRMNSMTDLHSLQEAIDLAAHSGCTMVVSHFVYQYGVGVEEEALDMVRRARGMGIDIEIDSGMYKDWCSSIGSALFEPGVMRANGIELSHLRMITGPCIGRQPDYEMYMHLRQAHPHDAVVVMTGDQGAVYTIQRYERTMVSTDTGAYLPGEGHPQIAGSFPRYLREMVRERCELSWEDAVRHITLLPAQVFGLHAKGRMRAGCDADLVIFDPETIADRADFPGAGRPDAANEGVRCVIVGGEIAVRNGRPTGVMAGRAIAVH
ncbi:MAG: amidohydrolase family protein [Eubacteriales bacterium]|nr:amidohydrolase family protein [Eubacteriales bacterium]